MPLFLIFLWVAFWLSTADTVFAQPASLNAAPALGSWADWKAACAKLPSNRSLQGQRPRKELLPLPQFRDFDLVLTAFFEQCKTGSLAQTTNWIGKVAGGRTFFNTDSAYFLEADASSRAPLPFEPFAQKLVVPEQAEIFFHADFHGDIRSLLTDLSWLNDHGILRGFTVARPNFYMIFLGDYTDRGAYGIEVLYTLFQLKVANPDQVFLLRGNHEDVSLAVRYGFLDEGKAKYGRDFDAKKLFRAYDFLPVVLYLGAGEDFIQCHHGGMEPGFDPRQLLSSPNPIAFQFVGLLNEAQFLSGHPEWLAQADAHSRELASRSLRNFQPADPISPTVVGFMWNDFAVFASAAQFDIDPGRAFVYGRRATEYLLGAGSTATRHLRAVFRGHQHSSVLNPMMRRLLASRGVFRHWQAQDSDALADASISQLAKVLEQTETRAIPPGSVWTFNVSPDSVYGQGCGYSFDSFAIVRSAAKFADWRLQIVNVFVAP